ncbi:MAG: hypothetical protein CM15mP58_09270 [Burkholderiaceae bacterium]|nr:MAG: hypothetical protein CM15mP58_09270 [Burkholderiaceae bacterium]
MYRNQLLSGYATYPFITRAGLEIGVASTKAFTTQLASLFVFALTLAKDEKSYNIQNERNF